MYALRQELISPNGVEHSLFMKLTSSCVSSSSQTKVIANLVVARSNLLRIFEVREEAAPLPSLEEVEGKANAGTSKVGTEAVEGEVEMDQEGEGFVSVAQVKVSANPAALDRHSIVGGRTSLPESQLHPRP
jgi:cleavage and polyadenylation specificity factor subunit 1